LSVELRKNRQGVSNWDDLIPEQSEPSEAPPAAPEEPSAAPVLWAIGGIEISDAAVRWQDAQSGTDLQISPFNLKTGEVQLEKPIDLKMDLVAHNQQPEIKANVTLKTKATVDPNSQIYRLEDFNLHVGGELIIPT
jgi:AsmA protein